MSKEEKISLEKLKNMAYDINCIGAEYCKIDEEDMNCNKCLRCAYDTISNYIDKLQKELEQERKLTNLIIDDFQAENYFINMTNKEVREYYSKRKELK